MMYTGYMDKKMAIGMAAIGLGAFLLGMVVAPEKLSAPVKSEKQNANIVRIVTVHEHTDPFYAIAMEYPQFDDASDVFNREIAEWAGGKLASFKTNARDNWKGRQDTTPPGQPKQEYPESPFTFAVTWESKQINATAISIIVRMDSFEGGAHGNSELKTFNYDVVRKKDVALADLFSGNAGYLGKVSKYAHDRLIEDLTSAGDGGDTVVNMIADGTAPTTENFTNFMFNDDVVDLYFPKYQVAPGVYGEQRVIMPRKGI
jgi:hypothetical protein